MTVKPTYEELERRTWELQEIGFDGMPGKFIDANRVAIKRLGYTNEELLKLTPKDITTENGYKRKEFFQKLQKIKQDASVMIIDIDRVNDIGSHERP